MPSKREQSIRWIDILSTLSDGTLRTWRLHEDDGLWSFRDAANGPWRLVLPDAVPPAIRQAIETDS